VTYDRAVLVEVITYHQRLDIGHCLCGWGVDSRPSALGLSHADHILDVYEASMEVRTQ